MFNNYFETLKLRPNILFEDYNRIFFFFVITYNFQIHNIITA